MISHLESVGYDYEHAQKGIDALTDASMNEYLVLAGTMIVNFVSEFLYDPGYFI